MIPFGAEPDTAVDIVRRMHIASADIHTRERIDRFDQHIGFRADELFLSGMADPALFLVIVVCLISFVFSYILKLNINLMCGRDGR